MKEEKIEDLINKLEQISQEMENENLSLDESIEKFKEGTRLANLANKKITEAEKKVKMLLTDENNELKEIDFNN